MRRPNTNDQMDDPDHSLRSSKITASAKVFTSDSCSVSQKHKKRRKKRIRHIITRKIRRTRTRTKPITITKTKQQNKVKKFYRALVHLAMALQGFSGK